MQDLDSLVELVRVVQRALLGACENSELAQRAAPLWAREAAAERREDDQKRALVVRV